MQSKSQNYQKFTGSCSDLLYSEPNRYSRGRRMQGFERKHKPSSNSTFNMSSISSISKSRTRDRSSSNEGKFSLGSIRPSTTLRSEDCTFSNSMGNPLDISNHNMSSRSINTTKRSSKKSFMTE